MKTLTTSCLECGCAISFSGGEVGTWEDCPDCGHRTLLSPLNSIASRSDRANYLAMIRRSSCYPTLRTLIDLLTLVGTLSAISSFGVPVKNFKSESWDGSPVDQAILQNAGMFLTIAAVTLIATFAFRELCLLLVDLGDAAIEVNSQRERAELQ